MSKITNYRCDVTGRYMEGKKHKMETSVIVRGVEFVVGVRVSGMYESKHACEDALKDVFRQGAEKILGEKLTFASDEIKPAPGKMEVGDKVCVKSLLATGMSSSLEVDGNMYGTVGMFGVVREISEGEVVEVVFEDDEGDYWWFHKDDLEVL